MTEPLPPAIFILGPTASGKTELAMALRERLPVEIISVDSAMIYRGMDIGTAKPSAEELARAPHRLIDILDPVESYSAARFREDALREMAEITAAGRIPLLVGGTGLYFRALEQGLSAMPASDPATRAELDAWIAEHGLDEAHRRLAEVDPAAAARIHRNDPQRLQRALEVFAISGRPISSFWGEAPESPPYRIAKLLLLPEREALRERIAGRFGLMLERGLIGEVERLFARSDLHIDLPSIRAVGYRQVWQYLLGELDRAEMEERGVIATRQYAKRQFTWLRGEQGAGAFDPLAPKLLDKVLKYLDREHI